MPTSTPRSFVHLHVHTEYSKQDGLARVKDVVKRAAEDHQPALAMTDHGNIAGAWKFAKECQAAGIKPILGCEFYMALVPDGSAGGEEPLAWDDPKVRFARTTRMQPDAESGKVKRNTNNHLTVLAGSEAGWRNLCRIANAAEQSFYYKPLIDYALLKQHSEGLIVLSGCLGGPVASQVAMARTDIRDDDGTVTDVEWDESILDRAREALAHLIECVGRENVYVEIMEHGLAAEGKHHIIKLAQLADEFSLRVVATNDSHYVDACDCDAHDSWLVNGERARGNHVSKSDPDRWRFNGTGYHLRTAEEMFNRYPEAPTWRSACEETVRLAERVEENVIPYKPLRLPRFPVPADLVAEWEAGTETTVEDTHGQQVAARKVGTGGRGFRTPSDLMLHRKVKDGAKGRYGERWSKGIAGLAERLRFEFDVITRLGLADYFLIVADVLDWARSDRGLPTTDHPEGVPGGKKPILVGPGRGSAAGSVISYCLGIVQVEPLSNGLLFERFLDVTRVGMPDIDVDFEGRRRDEVYEYLSARYGADYVARIGAFQVAKTKRAIKDAGRVLEMTGLAIRLTEAVPVHQGEPQSFAELFEEVTDADGNQVKNPEAREFRELVAADPEAAAVVDLARKFEDVVAGESIHAAAVIISDEPLTDLVPMYLKRDKKTGKPVGTPIAWWDGKDIDSFGMLKLDALGLSNLDVIAAAVANIESGGGTVDIDNLPDPGSDDPRAQRAMAMLREGDTAGVFQLESAGMTELCEQVGPTNFDDLTALVALFRPGPMAAGMHTLYADRKNGRATVDYSYLTTDPGEQAVIAEVLGSTYATVVYQEQLMELAEKVAGFTADEKNRLRKAFSKKDRPAMETLKETFIEQGQREMPSPLGGSKRSFRLSTLEKLWVTFDGSAEYLFNKSHSAAYAHVAYVTAFLKANWPTEYAAGLLAVAKKEEKRRATLFALRNAGTTVLAPDVNASLTGTAPDPGDRSAVRLGLSEVRDVGSNAEWIVTERERGGSFASPVDLVARVKVPGKDGKKSTRLPTNALVGLAEAGAFDSMGVGRLGVLAALRALGTGAETTIPDMEWSHLERSSRQRFRLGVALGEHPVCAYSDQLKRHPAHQDSVPLADLPDAGEVTVFAVVADWNTKTTKRGDKMANFTIEDSDAMVSGVIFPRAFARLNPMPQLGDLVAVVGSITVRDVTFTTVAEDGSEVEETRVVRELIAERIGVIDVGSEQISNLPEVAESERVSLAEVIPIAKAVRLRQSVPVNPDQPALLGVDATEQVTEEPPGPIPMTRSRAAKWAHVVRVDNGQVFYPNSHLLGTRQEWLLGGPASPDYTLGVGEIDITKPIIQRGPKSQNPVPAGTYNQHDQAFMLRDQRLLLVHTDRNEDSLALLSAIDPDHQAWQPTSPSGWFTAPLQELLPLAEDTSDETGVLVDLAEHREAGVA